jgi:quercetin dioxygenase-like cupin family protein
MFINIIEKRIFMQKGNRLNQLNSMYPSEGYMLENTKFTLPDYAKYCSLYGYSFGNSTLTIDNKTINLEQGQYFGLSVEQSAQVAVSDKLFLVVRLGYMVPNTLGWVEQQGRLSYIDGCSDSLLVYPARLGDSSLNLLYFPPGINQTFHRHPSIRLGCVISGQGYSTHGEYDCQSEDVLSTGTSFCLAQQERHRFRTESNSMTVVAFHPDGDWGPTDHNHTMLNRTYLDK